VVVPALPPYSGVPDADEYNMYRGMQIDLPAAAEHCLEHGLIQPEHLHAGARLNARGLEVMREGPVGPWLEHLRRIWCKKDEAQYAWVLSFFAHALQRPWEKPKVALIVRSDGMGAGKGCILAPIASILGEFDLQTAGKGGLYTKTSEPDDVFGKFTAKLSGKLFLVLDEAYWAKSNRDKNKLRALVTEPTHSIRLMHTDPFTERSYLRIVFLSNDAHLVPYEPGERRFFVLDLSNEYAGLETDETRAHFDPIWHTNPHALALYLHSLDIEAWRPAKFGVTEQAWDQIRQSLPPLTAWWYACLQRGYVARQQATRLVTLPGEQGSRQILQERTFYFAIDGNICCLTLDILYKDYEKEARGLARGKHVDIVDRKTFEKKLRNLAGEANVYKGQKRFGAAEGKKMALWFGSLSACREAFQICIKYNDIEWEECPHDSAAFVAEKRHHCANANRLTPAWADCATE